LRFGGKMAQKSVSQWKQKTAYTILAPENFENHVIGQTIVNDPKNLIGRTIEVSLADLTKDKSKQHSKLIFEINDVRGDRAYTKFKKLDTSMGYIRSKIHKGVSKIDYISDLNISGTKVRLKTMILTNHQITKSQGKDIIVVLKKVLNEHRSTKFDQFIQLILFGKLGTEIYHKIKSICPISRVELWQMRILR